MNTRNITNLGLLVFVVIAASLVILDNKDKDEKQPITSLQQNDVVNITVKRPDKKDIYLEKKHNIWHLIRPYNTATNQFRMDTLLRLLETIPQSTYPLRNAEKYGLTTEKLEVIFNRGETNTVSIRFGDSDPLKMRRYISVDNKLHLTNDTYFYALNSIATDYISNKLLPDDFKIVQFDLPDLKLKINNGRWEMTPTSPDFSEDNVNELITEWENLKTTAIKAINTKTNFSHKKIIKLYGSNATTLTFYILRNDKEFILIDKLKGLQYSFPKEMDAKLLNLPASPIHEEMDKTQ